MVRADWAVGRSEKHAAVRCRIGIVSAKLTVAYTWLR